MEWKKSTAFFVWQSVLYAESLDHFKKIWQYKQQWKSSFLGERNSVKDELPWINYFAQEVLVKELKPEFRVFEFGGGGSTLFFCKNVAEVATVEDNPEWFNILRDIVRAKGIKHWTGYFIPPEPVSETKVRSHKKPEDFMSRMEIHRLMSFEKYAKSIQIYPHKYFDVILVDGRARPSCIQQALPYLKPNGLLVVDNTERDYYLEPFDEIIKTEFEILEERMAPVSYTPDFTKTTILRRLVK
jgi:predicted O-methyltransferase YrrM